MWKYVKIALRRIPLHLIWCLKYFMKGLDLGTVALREFYIYPCCICKKGKAAAVWTCRCRDADVHHLEARKIKAF